MNVVAEFVGDPLAPTGGGFDLAAMGRGEPGLPSAFTWRGETVGIDSVPTIFVYGRDGKLAKKIDVNSAGGKDVSLDCPVYNYIVTVNNDVI